MADRTMTFTTDELTTIEGALATAVKMWEFYAARYGAEECRKRFAGELMAVTVEEEHEAREAAWAEARRFALELEPPRERITDAPYDACASCAVPTTVAEECATCEGGPRPGATDCALGLRALIEKMGRNCITTEGYWVSHPTGRAEPTEVIDTPAGPVRLSKLALAAPGSLAEPFPVLPGTEWKWPAVDETGFEGLGYAPGARARMEGIPPAAPTVPDSEAPTVKFGDETERSAKPTFRDALREYLRRLNAAEKARAEKSGHPQFASTFDVSPGGQKYIRVIQIPPGSTDGLGAAHAFVVKRSDKLTDFPLGAILKSDGWKRPALNFKRGSIFELPEPREGYADPVLMLGR